MEKHRPQDPGFDLAGFTFESVEHGGREPDSMPVVIRVTDKEGRTALYAPIREHVPL